MIPVFGAFEVLGRDAKVFLVSRSPEYHERQDDIEQTPTAEKSSIIILIREENFYRIQSSIYRHNCIDSKHIQIYFLVLQFFFYLSTGVAFDMMLSESMPQISHMHTQILDFHGST